MEAALSRFQAAHTQVLGVSVDSVYSHANWARDLGGISFPLLPDFEPKGAVAKSCELYLDKAGISDRATVIIDSAGVVRHAASVGPGGERSIDELVATCQGIDRESSSPTTEFPRASVLPADAVLYVKNNCGFSRAVLLARDNLHLQEALKVKNVSEDKAAASELKALGGTGAAPCLVVDAKPLPESAAIIDYLVGKAAVPLA